MKLRNKNTGEIWDIGKILTNDYPSYDRLKDIIDDFEDISSEPLIKDKQTREEIKLFAYRNEIGCFRYQARNGALYNEADNGAVISLEVSDIEEVGNLVDGYLYTLDELCGESDNA